MTDQAGQAHLTALGALMGLRRVRGEDGAPAPSGVVFPEQLPNPQNVPSDLAAQGVDLVVLRAVRDEQAEGRAA